MSDPISVLLIIGAAVVGPIDGYSRGRQLMREPDQCLAEERAKHPGPPDLSFLACSDPRPAETIAPLCERVMREVGAAYQLPGAATGYMVGTDGRYASGVEVRCVPVPAGYRR